MPRLTCLALSLSLLACQKESKPADKAPAATAEPEVCDTPEKKQTAAAAARQKDDQANAARAAELAALRPELQSAVTKVVEGGLKELGALEPVVAKVSATRAKLAFGELSPAPKVRLAEL